MSNPKIQLKRSASLPSNASLLPGEVAIAGANLYFGSYSSAASVAPLRVLNQNDLTEIQEITNGKTATYTFETLLDFKTTVGGTVSDDCSTITVKVTPVSYKTGDIVLIKDVNVPDYWYDDTAKTFYKMETTKVDLSVYAKTELVNLQLAVKVNNSQIKNNWEELSPSDTITYIPSWALVNSAIDTLATSITNIKTAIESMNTNIASCIKTSTIVDNLNSTSTDLPLSANQGKILNVHITATNDNVENITARVASLENTIDGGIW